ncbi:hypothetical protein AGMMS49965_03800 [Bacteroidia bacterium]|nr:hypothetical protein AGMMS49965_03800 [Bacteroidia bacterium]
MLNQAKRFSRFIFAAVLASSTLSAFAQTLPSIGSVVVKNTFTPIYNGTQQLPLVGDLSIMDNSGDPIVSGVTIAIEGTSVSDGTVAGVVKIEVTGDGLSYTGSGVATYSIAKKIPTIADLTDITFPTSVVYDGTNHSSDWSTASFGPDFQSPMVDGSITKTVKYGTATSLPLPAGTYPVTVEFLNDGVNFTAGTVNLGTYEITKATLVEGTHLDAMTYTKPSSNNTFTGTPIGVTGSMALDGTFSDASITFTVKYNGSTTIPTDVGSYTVTADIANGDNFSDGTITLSTFTIDPEDVASAITFSPASSVYTGSPLTPAITVINAATGATLVEDVDYTAVYSSNIDVSIGTATVTISGIGNYNSTSSETFNITEKSLNTTDIDVTFPTAPSPSSPVFTYNSLVQTPPIIVRDNSRGAAPGALLVAGIDYETALVYNNNQDAEVGAEVVITGKGNYDPMTDKTVPFTIAKKVLTINNVAIASKTFNNSSATGAVTLSFTGEVPGETLAPGTIGGGDDYEIVANFDNATAGLGKSVHGTVELDPAGPLGKNYTFASGLITDLPSGLTADINKKPPFTVTPDDLLVKDFSASASNLYTFDLNLLVISDLDAGPRSYAKVDSVVDGSVHFGPVSLSGTDNRTLSYTLTAGTDLGGAGSAAITVKVATPNYDTATVSLPIVFTNKIIETLNFAITDTTVTYGAPKVVCPAIPGANNHGAIVYSSTAPTVADVNFNGEVTIKGKGSATITATIASDADYTGAVASYELTVEPAPLTVTALPQTIERGAGPIAVASPTSVYSTAPTTVEYSGWVNDEDESVLDTDPVLDCANLYTSAGEDFGAITFLTEAEAANYKVTSIPGDLTVADVPEITNATAVGDDSEVIVRIVSETDNYDPITKYKVTLTPVDPADPAIVVERPVPSPIRVPAINGKEYTVEVEAFNNVGTNWGPAYTIAGTVTPRAEDTRAATAPSNIVAVADTAKATVTFDAADPGNPAKTITGYTVRSTPHGIEKTGTGTSIIVTGLTPDTTYTFKVTVNFDDESGMTSVPSNAVTILAPATDTDPEPNPTAPTIDNVTKGTAGDGKATVAFTAHNEGKAVTKYTVVSNPGNISKEDAESPITVEGLTPGETYTFTVTVTFEDGTTPLTSDPSESLKLEESEEPGEPGEPGDGTGLPDVEEVATAKLYPNPATESVTITGLQGNETIRFYDANGRAVLTHKAKNSVEVIPVSQLQKGIYIVRIGTKALKLVKI